MAFCLATEVSILAKKYGLENLGFLTFTFADPVKCIKEAQRRFHSLNTAVISERYKRAISCVERQGSGRLHFHLLAAVNAPIRQGVDFKAFAAGDYRSAGPELRAEWAFWRKTCPKFGFGRHELMPIKSNEEAIGRYVGKYISKHIGHRESWDRGARLVRFLGYGPGERSVYTGFSWNTDGAWIWRHKLKAWATRKGFANTDAIKAFYGPRWAWTFKEEICSEPISGEIFPSFSAINRSVTMSDPLVIAQYRAQKVLESKQFVKTYILKKL